MQNLFLMQEKESKLMQLFHEIQSGDRTAFDELFNMYYQRLLIFAKQYIKQHESAEEIACELFVKLWLKRDTLSSVLNPEVYLYVSVKNACLNFIRSNKKRAALFLDNESLPTNEKVLGNYSTIEDKELVKLLDAAVDCLPEQRRLIFKLIKEDGLKTAAVAQILGLSKRTVENQLYKAVKALAEAISDYLGYHPQSKIAKKQALSELSILFFL